MKTLIIFAVFVTSLLFIATPSKACDLCGCGAGNYYLGVMPQFQKNFVGLRYRQSNFDSHLGSASEYSSLFETQERFYTAEIWARFYPHPKLQVLAFLPYQWNFQDENNKTKSLSGMADASVLAQYEILNTTNDTISQKFEHSFFVGGGIKLPTGKSDYNDEDALQVANANFQLGTGSTDFILTTQYTIRYKKAGFTADLSYKINTENSQDYRFGNRVSSNASLFYVKQIGKVGIMPTVGAYYEHSQQDIREDKTVFDTGGNLLNAVFGTQIYTGRFMLGLNYHTPLKQNLANNQIKSNDRFMIQTAFLF
ncbi:hypothetical protein Fleli_1778 [Bernardetia litoralis DSM 6794]|uniref:Transporter n=1 Tax=Bernardetia litoralis (strain ATCC 23117 / DSM 6794 / NBRC 15988 / NCIMB 1366 / Fx l1 / Sio-4) TaxID=880071 RepID=I4AJP2_BERLS|nr:hypothetical protein [Bernardetia litoralis]AFM04177.1 hypothetical protein Fleli_1778 [Bernardetia litoralis DSM 6794]